MEIIKTVIWQKNNKNKHPVLGAFSQKISHICWLDKMTVFLCYSIIIFFRAIGFFTE